ncbi:hypothetical protein E1A91_A10G136400v1 [Gossypium mustelinum]|uniref:Uncharacterized protein n=1 Tax=Gossypium mustelinum TaxID=34275 RepID=A0A5D2XLI2_GOSMU|nr:hypothetical protein E1A91_A10G136400v1 [Gossypium mustelinum]
MKLYKKYQEYMQGQEKKLSSVGLKKIFKNCRRELQSKNDVLGFLHNQICPQHCPDIMHRIWCLLHYEPKLKRMRNDLQNNVGI